MTKQVIYTHIPKTAGTYLEDIFFKIYPNKACRGITPGDIQSIKSNYKFISGHVAYEFYKKIRSNRTIFITIIRDPVDQLISHLNHISNEPIDQLPPLVLKIRALLDTYGIENIFDRMDEESLDFFTNPQTKALLNTGESYLHYLSNPVGAYKEIHSNYEYVGITEAIPEFLGRVFKGLKISFDEIDLNFKSNVKKKSVWHRGAISKFWIEKLLSLDLAVYQMIKEDVSANKNSPKNLKAHNDRDLGECVITNEQFFSPSPQFLKRLKNFYRESVMGASEIESQLWRTIFSKQKEIHEALLADDDSLQTLLANPSKTNLYYGVDNLARDLMPAVYSTNLEHGRIGISKAFALLFNSMGILHLFNPYGQNNQEFKDENLEHLLNVLEAELKLRNLTFPNPFIGEMGMKTTKGVASIRAIYALHQAWRLMQISKIVGGNSVLEIGAGMGRTAYYSFILGLNYSIVDLPMTLIGQALFLAATLGEDAVNLFGEKGVGNQINLIPPNHLNAIKAVNLVLNVDSLTQMDHDSARRYSAFCNDQKLPFLSINHEADEFTCAQVFDGLNGLYRASRSPYWFREGYVEELFLPKFK